MNWTKEKPTVPGWYWFRRESDGETCVRHFFIVPSGARHWLAGKLCMEVLSNPAIPAVELNGEFAGPIPEPTESQ